MPRPLRLLAAACLVVVLGAGCSGDDAGSPGPEDLEGGLEINATVVADDFSFDPDDVTVDPGETVEWRNDGDVVHAVVADDALFDSGELHPGESSAFTFDTPGRHEYHCSIHPKQMRGVIVVAD
jgi:plastocyanin